MSEEEYKELEKDIMNAFSKLDYPEYNEATNTYTIRDKNFVAVINADIFCKAMQEAAKNFNEEDYKKLINEK